MTKPKPPWRAADAGRSVTDLRKALLLMFLISAFAVAGETRAQCSCAPDYRDITPQKEFNLAYAVFVGRVVTVKKTPRDENGHYVETVTFEVTKAWKHELDSKLTITNKIQGCLNGFEQNEEWLVYAYRHTDGTLGTGCCCSRTKPLRKAAEDLKSFANEAPAKIRRTLNGPNQSLDASGGSVFRN